MTYSHDVVKWCSLAAVVDTCKLIFTVHTATLLSSRNVSVGYSTFVTGNVVCLFVLLAVGGVGGVGGV